ncbi:MAG: hypothetical protein ABSB71_07755 [Candidatus Bathyarchaeia archaeon]|jgi:DNA-binding HxlR family transcriptional regulator
MPFRDLEKQGALQILVYLYDNRDRKINVSELDRNVKATRETILSTLKMLKVNRLIQDEVNKKFPFDHSIWLNQKGVEVATQLKVAQNALLDQEHPKKTEDSEPVG